MNLIKQLSTLQPNMVRWRHELHKYPETAYEETRTADLVGHERVLTNIDPLMGSEDFGWMLHERPGCYLFLGNGIGDTGGCMVHNPHYDFNDDILHIGAAYWVELARTLLPASR